MSDTKGHTIQIVDGPAGPSLYLDDYRIAGPKPWGGGTVLYEFAFKDKDLIAAGVTCSAESDQQVSATPAPLDVERLARALERMSGVSYPIDPGDCMAGVVTHREFAAAIAAAYAEEKE